MSYRILIADDNDSARQALRAMLVQSGFVVEMAEDGSSALRRLLEFDFDLSLLDIHMPALTGIEVLSQLHSAGLAVPSILMTGHPSRAIEAAAMEAGALAMLRKPIPAEVLRIVVRRVINRETPPDQAPQT